MLHNIAEECRSQQNTWFSLGQDSNWAPPRHKLEALTLEQLTLFRAKNTPDNALTQRCTILQETPQNSGCQTCAMKQVPHQNPQIIDDTILSLVLVSWSIWRMGFVCPCGNNGYNVRR
jgi:hypothetical protein